MTTSSFVQPRITTLNPEQIEQIHNYSLEILFKVGIRIDSPKAMELFSKSDGVRIKENRVFISPELVNWALNNVPSEINIFDRNGRPAFTAGDGQVRFGVGVTNLFYQDPKTDKLAGFTREHMASSTRLTHNLKAYDLVSTIGIISDVPNGKEDLFGVLEMVSNSTKPLIILNSDENQFNKSLDLVEYLHGNLSEKPFLVPYFNPVTPLIINRETSDKMITAIQRGLPVIYSNYSMIGATTPITSAGTLTLLNAELLAGLVLSQLIRQGSAIILGSLPAFFDMKSMTDFYDPHTILINAACAEMMAHYHVPHAGTSGSGLGWGADLPAAGMHWLNHITNCLGKTGLVPFVGGSLGSKAFSPTSVVYANDIILQAKYFSSGFLLDADSVGLDEIAQIGPGGNFLTAKSTRKHFRTAYYTSELFPRISLEKWEQQGQPQAIDYLKDETVRLISNAKPPIDHGRLISAGEEFISRL